MKITIYELIGLVKDGKAPEKIRYNNEIWKYDDELKTYDNDDYDSDLLEKLFYESCISNFINNEVEIIEEPKKIEYEQIEELTCNEYDFEKKTINSLIKNQRKLIDEINNLKEND